MATDEVVFVKVNEASVSSAASFPMEFIPSTWQPVRRDGNGDGKADPFNIDDAALSAAT